MSIGMVVMIGIAQEARALGHAVEAQEQALRLELERRERAFEVGLERADIERVVVIRRKRAERRLSPLAGQKLKQSILRRCCRRPGILRVERREQHAVDARMVDRA
jgi:hypothetical protein